MALLVRLAAAAVVLAGPVLAKKASGPISQKEAQCILKNKQVVFVGDSNSRFHWFSFNDFLRTGNEGECYAKNGCGDQIDEGTWKFWTTEYGRSGDGAHLRTGSKKLPNGIESKFWFVQTSWFDDQTKKPMDGHTPNMNTIVDEIDKDTIVIYNSNWWELKNWQEKDRGYVFCGDKLDKKCEDSYRADTKKALQELCGSAGACVYRSASCCGDYVSGADGTSVAKFNAIAEAVAEDVGAAYVDVFKYYGPDDIKENTKDGKHASADNYVKWTMDVLQAIDDQLQTGCIAVEPTRKPTKEPTREPTREPTCARGVLTLRVSRGDGVCVTYAVDASPRRRYRPTFQPTTPGPTPKPTAMPSYEPTREPTRRPTLEPTQKPQAPNPVDANPTPRPSAMKTDPTPPPMTTPPPTPADAATAEPTSTTPGPGELVLTFESAAVLDGVEADAINSVESMRTTFGDAIKASSGGAFQEVIDIEALPPNRRRLGVDDHAMVTYTGRYVTEGPDPDNEKLDEFKQTATESLTAATKDGSFASMLRKDASFADVGVDVETTLEQIDDATVSSTYTWYSTPEPTNLDLTPTPEPTAPKPIPTPPPKDSDGAGTVAIDACVAVVAAVAVYAVALF